MQALDHEIDFLFHLSQVLDLGPDGHVLVGERHGLSSLGRCVFRFDEIVALHGSCDSIRHVSTTFGACAVVNKILYCSQGKAVRPTPSGQSEPFILHIFDDSEALRFVHGCQSSLDSVMYKFTRNCFRAALYVKIH